jgi:GT2 family glycosyltransferase
MVRREAIDSVRLLDEGYFMYAEEVDWCWRMQRAGWPAWCVPAARVLHHGGASTQQFRARSFVNLWRSRKRLYERFYSPARLAAAARIVQLGMGVEASRAHRAARSGIITPVELNQRLAATREAAGLFQRTRTTS